LDSLIRREIEARTIFLLCDSPNSRSARWVEREVEFIRSLPDRHYEVVNLQLPWPLQRAVLDRISQRTTLYLDYRGEDKETVWAISETLAAFDYSIFDSARSLRDDPFTTLRKQSERAITESLSNGFYIHFVSPEWAKRMRGSPLVFEDLNRAIEERRRLVASVRNVIVVLVGDPLGEIELSPPLSDFVPLDLRGLQPSEQARRLHQHLCTASNEFNRNA
jgi:hypothetical protein